MKHYYVTSGSVKSSSTFTLVSIACNERPVKGDLVAIERIDEWHGIFQVKQALLMNGHVYLWLARSTVFTLAPLEELEKKRKSEEAAAHARWLQQMTGIQERSKRVAQEIAKERG